MTASPSNASSIGKTCFTGRRRRWRAESAARWPAGGTGGMENERIIQERNRL